MARPPNAAVVQDVQEVSLLGSADLAFWEEHLRAEGLRPAVHQGQARITVVATAARFKGVPFRELAITVAVAGEDEAGFLVHAFNTSRFFAFIERTCFKTPYYPGQVELGTETSAAFSASRDGQVLLRAEALPDAGQSQADWLPDRWEGRVHLPRRHGADWCFHAEMSGPSRRFAFDPEYDTLAISRADGVPVLGWLLESGFRGSEWLLRRHAVHAKSKTLAEGRPSAARPGKIR